MILPKIEKLNLSHTCTHTVAVYKFYFTFLTAGYKVYIGYIQCEAIQNNPIVHVFLDILYNRVQDHRGLTRKPLSGTVSVSQTFAPRAYTCYV